MTSPVTTEEVILQDPILQQRIADLAKFGILWTPPSKRPVASEVEETVPAAPAVPSLASSVAKASKHPRKKVSAPDVLSEPESESEMMGSVYQDAAKAAEQKRDAHLAQGLGVPRAVSSKLDDEAFAHLGLEMGENAVRLENFVPWRFLVRYGVSTDMAWKTRTSPIPVLLLVSWILELTAMD